MASLTEDGELVGEIVLNPEKNYQPIQRRNPNLEFTGSSVRDDLTHRNRSPDGSFMEPHRSVDSKRLALDLNDADRRNSRS